MSRIAVFGSHARDEARSESDIDLLVEFAQDRTPDLFSFAGLKLELEKRVGATVDLFTQDSLHPGLRDLIEASLIDDKDWRILIGRARAHASEVSRSHLESP